MLFTFDILQYSLKSKVFQLCVDPPPQVLFQQHLLFNRYFLQRGLILEHSKYKLVQTYFSVSKFSLNLTVTSVICLFCSLVFVEQSRQLKQCWELCISFSKVIIEVEITRELYLPLFISRSVFNILRTWHVWSSFLSLLQVTACRTVNVLYFSIFLAETRIPCILNLNAKRKYWVGYLSTDKDIRFQY